MFVLLMRHGETHAVLPQIVTNLATVGGLVTRPPVGTPFWTTAAGPSDRTLLHQGLEDRRRMLLARRQYTRDQLPPAFGTAVGLRPEAALAPAERFGRRVAAWGPGGMLMGANDGRNRGKSGSE